MVEDASRAKLHARNFTLGFQTIRRTTQISPIVIKFVGVVLLNDLDIFASRHPLDYYVAVSITSHESISMLYRVIKESHPKQVTSGFSPKPLFYADSFQVCCVTLANIAVAGASSKLALFKWSA